MGLFGPKRFGLALGSGSARGIAHVGVLKAFDEAGLRPDVIAGTSMGAVIGAFYAAGIPAGEIPDRIPAHDVRGLFGLADPTLQRGAMMNGERMEEFLRENLPATFEELEIPFGCVATDLTRSVAVRFTSGDLVTAVRASMSVPVVLRPVRLGDALLVDGFLTEPVPVGLARDLGARVVVAVEVGGSGTVVVDDNGGKEAGLVRTFHAALTGNDVPPRRPSSLGILLASVETAERQITREMIRDADIVISPEVHSTTGIEFMAMTRLIEAGEEAGRAAVELVRRKTRR